MAVHARQARSEVSNCNLPFYVFVDLNLPPAATEEIWEGWLQELHKTMRELEQEGYSDPAPDNAIFFANDPSHFLGDEQIGHDADCGQAHTRHVVRTTKKSVGGSNSKPPVR